MFLGEKKCLGHNPPPLNHGFGVDLALAYTSFPVPKDTIFVVFSCHKQRIKLAILVLDSRNRDLSCHYFEKDKPGKT